MKITVSDTIMWFSLFVTDSDVDDDEDDDLSLSAVYNTKLGNINKSMLIFIK